jgi:protein SCO1/2
MTLERSYRLCGFLAFALLQVDGLTAASAAPRAPEGLLRNVGFDQNIGAQLPLDGWFRGADGAPARLGELLNHEPALLLPNYYGCTNLCGTMRAAVAQAVGRTGLRPGIDFEVLLVSVDTREGPAEARGAQIADISAHPEGNPAAWRYLTGSQEAVSGLMRSIGFRYFFDSRNDQFAHAAGIVLVTPEGRIAQYLFGVRLEPESLRLGLVNASHEKIGTLVDQLLLLCCNYDASTGRYSLTINLVMRWLGIATALCLAALVLFLSRSDQRRRSPSENS